MTQHDRQPDSEHTPERLDRLMALFEAYNAAMMTHRALRDGADGTITAPQFEALQFISHHAGCSVTALADGLGMSNASATRLVDRLVAKELLERRMHPKDRRQVVLQVTNPAHVMLRRVREARIATLQNALAQLQENEQLQFFTILERFLTAALQHNPVLYDCSLRCGDDRETGCVVRCISRQIDHDRTLADTE